MKKLLLTLMLSVVSNSAMAEWEFVASGKDNLDKCYADPTTIRKKGNIVKMWVMWDYSVVAHRGSLKPHKSARVQNEYNCKEETIRQIYATTFSGNMLEGNIIESAEATKWIPVAPSSLGKALWEFACGK